MYMSVYKIFNTISRIDANVRNDRNFRAEKKYEVEFFFSKKIEKKKNTTNRMIIKQFILNRFIVICTYFSLMSVSPFNATIDWKIILCFHIIISERRVK